MQKPTRCLICSIVNISNRKWNVFWDALERETRRGSYVYCKSINNNQCQRIWVRTHEIKAITCHPCLPSIYIPSVSTPRFRKMQGWKLQAKILDTFPKERLKFWNLESLRHLSEGKAEFFFCNFHPWNETQLVHQTKD